MREKEKERVYAGERNRAEPYRLLVEVGDYLLPVAAPLRVQREQQRVVGVVPLPARRVPLLIERERRGKTHMRNKREVKKACHSVPSQWYHSGDATSNRDEREREKREKSF